MTDKPAPRMVQAWIPTAAAGFAIVAAVSSYFAEQGARTQIVESMQAEIASQQKTIAKMDTEIDTIKLFEASTCQQFAKIETQFGAVETVVNLNHVNNERALGALKSKVFGEQEPSIYYPVSIPHELGSC